MAVDISALATSIVTSFLVPYAKVGVKKISEVVGQQIGEKAGKYVTDLTGKVWNRVTSAFSSSEDQAIINLFQKNPNEMEAMLVKALQSKLEQDSSLAQALADLIETPGPDGQNTGAQIMNASVAGIADLRGANLSQATGFTISGVSINKDSNAES